MEEGVVLGFLSTKGIQVDPAKIEIISKLLVPQKKRDIRSFLGHVGYYKHFIKGFSNIFAFFFTFLAKEVGFEWTKICQ